MQRNVFNSIIAVLLSIFSPLLFAQSFQHELKYNYAKTTENYISGKRIGNAASYKYFFSDVENSSLPLAEMEFGTRISSLGLSYSLQDTETVFRTVGVFGSVYIGDQTKDFTISGEYKHPTTGWFINGSYRDGNSQRGIDADTQGLDINFGKYISEFTTISLGFTDREVDTDPYELNLPCGWQPGGAFFVCGPPTTGVIDQKSEIETYKISARHLLDIAGQYFAFGLNYQDTETTSTIDVSGSVPISPGVSSFDSKSYGGDVTAYFGRNLSAKFLFSKFENDGIGSSEPNHFGISFEYYFFSRMAVSFGYNLKRANLG